MSERPLRVLYVNPSSAPAGSVRSLRFLIQGFPPGAVEAVVLTPPGRADAEFRAAGARTLPIPAISLFQNIRGIPVRGLRWGSVLRAVWQLRHGEALRDAIRNVDPDLVHLNDHGMFQAAVAAHRLGKPVLMHVRAVADRESAWQGPLTAYFLRRYVDQVVAIDRSVSGSLPPVGPVRVIYNPVASDAALPARRGGPITFSFLAGLAEFKGVSDLLEAASILRDRKDLVFRLYGENRWPPDFHASLRGRLGSWLGLTRDVERDLREGIVRRGLQDSVRLMGHVPAEDGVFAETDVVVFPSRLNGVGRSVFEAGVQGIPSVVALRDRVEDIVQDGVTGLIVPEADPKALAAAIARLADDPALRSRLGEQARARYRTQFDARSIAGQMLETYGTMLGPSRRG
ncbi:MAG: glycosyltransferase family 4 protein [Planctomycetes bacterium]|nr:glycosyltransferase family 4 protein [Planctomycetota bacterium]